MWPGIFSAPPPHGRGRGVLEKRLRVLRAGAPLAGCRTRTLRCWPVLLLLLVCRCAALMGVGVGAARV